MKIYCLDTKPVNYTDVTQQPLIGEVPFSPTLYELFQLNGDWYTVGIIAGTQEYGGACKIENLNYDKDAETVRETSIICPVCSYEDNNSWETEDTDFYNCGQCGAGLSIDRDVSVTYSASVVTLPDIRR